MQMKTILLLKAFAVWLLILVFAVLNGSLREFVLLPILGKPAAFALSGILLSIVVLLAGALSQRWTRVSRLSHCLWLGVFWLALTLAFEFAFGLFVQHKNWRELGDAYTFKDGNLWPLVLVACFCSPVIAHFMRRQDS